MFHWVKFKYKALAGVLVFAIMLSNSASLSANDILPDRFERRAQSEKINNWLSRQVGKLTGSGRTLAELNASGGFRTKAPYLTEDETWFIPFITDISGASGRALSAQKRSRYRAIKGIDALRSATNPNEIYLTVRTTHKTKKHPYSFTKGVDVGALTAGTYTVFYADPGGDAYRLMQFEVE